MFRRTLSLLGLAAVAAWAVPAFAGAPKNLKVINKDIKEKDLETSMKAWTKGLGVKCEACHLKGKPDSDEPKAKEPSREFLKKVIGNADEAAKKAALADLVKALELKEVKNEGQIWESLAKLTKQ